MGIMINMMVWKQVRIVGKERKEEEKKITMHASKMLVW